MRNPSSRLMLSIEIPSQRVKKGARMRYSGGGERYNESGAAPATGSESAGVAVKRAARMNSVSAAGSTCRVIARREVPL